MRAGSMELLLGTGIYFDILYVQSSNGENVKASMSESVMHDDKVARHDESMKMRRHYIKDDY